MKAAEVLSQHKNEILEAWLAKVHEQVPPSRGKSRPAIVDDIPEVIDEMCERLRKHKAGPTKCGIEHGRQRASFVGYSLSQVLREYHVLKHILFTFLDKNGVALSERDAVARLMDETIEHSSESFFNDRLSEVLLEQDQAHFLATQEKHNDAVKLEALQSNESAREHFVAALSHDLRNPLSAISMAVDLLEEDGDDTKLRAEMLAIVKRNLIVAKSLLNNLLDANLIKSGKKLPLQLTDVRLDKLIGEVIALYLPGREHSFQLTSEVPAIQGYWDPDALRRALGNLISNAIKYGDTSRPITVKCEQSDDMTSISVRNFGNPISLDEQSRLFKHYYRSSHARRSPKEGWGLGLTLVEGVAEAHGGRVLLTSSEREGTNFTILIPTRAGEARP